MYIWRRRDWPDFRWDTTALLGPLAQARLQEGRLLGRMQGLGFDLQLQAELQALTQEAIKSSEIEGELLDHASVRSSLARRLGVPEAAVARSDRRTEGVVELTLDATHAFDEPLTAERLFRWHGALFPRKGKRAPALRVGAWRDDAAGPMQVVSGALGRERVHYEAPPAAKVDAQMKRFLKWFAAPPATDGLLRAALAHLWFVTIHPFDDGNGRIARAIADQALAQAEGMPQRFYSMSGQIRKERADYYAILEQAQRGDLDVTPWLVWFLGCFTRAVVAADSGSNEVLRKAEFWRRFSEVPLSERQRSMLNRILDGFEGKITAKKWMKLGKCSLATAQRDINELVEAGVLVKGEGGSKRTSYGINVDREELPSEMH